MAAAVSGVGAAFSPSNPIAAPGILQRAQENARAAWKVAKLTVEAAGDKVGVVAIQILNILRPNLGGEVLALLWSVRDIVRTVINARKQAALAEEMDRIKQQNAALQEEIGQLQQRNAFLEQQHPEVSKDRAFVLQENRSVVEQNGRLKEENGQLTARCAALAQAAAERDQLRGELQQLQQQLPLLQSQMVDHKTNDANEQRPGSLLEQWMAQIETDRVLILRVQATMEGTTAKLLLQDIYGRLGRWTSRVAQFLPVPQPPSPHQARAALPKFHEAGA